MSDLRRGLAIALASAGTFGTAGAFADPLLEAGWSPGAAVIARVTLAALILTVPALLAMRGKWQALRQQAWVSVVYGTIAVAICQLCFFTAVSRLSVGIALLLEYMGVLLVVLWLWVRHGQRPRRLTVMGSGLAMLGLVFVLDVFGGVHVDIVGVLWALLAGVGLAVYYVLSSRAGDGVPPIGLAWSGLVVGAVTLIAAGALGIMPLHARFTDVHLAGHWVSWLVPVLGVALSATVVAYVAGIAAARLLGPKVASFVGLTEVLFAVLWAWVLLGQLPHVVQLFGGALILAGVALVRADERPAAQVRPEELTYAG